MVLDQAAILELIDQLRVAVPPEVAQARRVTEEATRITERGATRADDKFSEAAMEDRKREGYF